MVFCVKCGQQESDTASFCRACGAKLVTAAEEARQPPDIDSPAPQEERTDAASEPATFELSPAALEEVRPFFEVGPSGPAPEGLEAASIEAQAPQEAPRVEPQQQPAPNPPSVEPPVVPAPSAFVAPVPTPAAAALQVPNPGIPTHEASVPALPQFEITCIAGPDQYKKFSLGAGSITLGRSARAGALSDDPEVESEHVILSVTGGRLSFASAGGAIFVEGVRLESGQLEPGRQFRVGRSTWEFRPLRAEARPVDPMGFLSTLSQTYMGAVDRPGGTRSDQEAEAILAVGTATTTPDLKDVEASWPSVWLFGRVFALSLLAFVLFTVAIKSFENPIALPGMMIIGAGAVPLSILTLFFEWNIPRNISIYQVIRMFVMGGVVSILLSIALFKLTSLDSWMGPAAAGIIEEAGKVGAILLVAGATRYRWTLNGLLIGGAVGAGFSVFETAGYAFAMLVGTGNVNEMITSLGLRSITEPAGHAAWAALTGAALWKVKGDRKFESSMLGDPRFLRVFAYVAAIHAVWNSSWTPDYYLKELLLIAATWLAIFSFVADGINQIKQAKETAGGH